MHRKNKGIYVWGAVVQSLSRVWVCGHCGVKVYYGQLALQPDHLCVCGKLAWEKRSKKPEPQIISDEYLGRATDIILH